MNRIGVQDRPVSVLLADDSAANRDMLVRRLTRHGFHLDVAKDGVETLERARPEEFDLLLLDIMLPDMTGIEVLEELRRLHSATAFPIIMVTADATSETLVEALDKGANDYVTKPVNLPVLLARIDNQIRSKEAERKLRELAAGLEDMVAERTAELQTANENLQAEIETRKRMEAVSVRLTAAVEALSESVAIFDAEDRLVFGNQQFRKYNKVVEDYVVPGTPYETLMRQLVKNGMFPEADGREEEWLAERIDQHRNPRGNLEIKHRNGVHLLVAEERLPDGGIATLATDITERVKAERAREELEAQLRQAQKLETLGTLTNGIAHDFNNILSPIMGYVDMALRDLEEGSRIYSNLWHVLVAAKRAKELVEQILFFGGTMEKEPQDLNVADVVEEALKLLRPSIPSTIEIESRTSPGLPLVRADPTQIHQIVMNLCTNAYQAMRNEGGILTVEVDEIAAATATLQKSEGGDRSIRLRITDTGPGMEPTIIDRIFEPFFTTKEVGEGTGLGLSVVHGIVVSHSGSITVDSEPGRGTVFDICLPALDTDSTIERTVVEEVRTDPAVGGRLLLVDDDKDVADLGRQMLERLGYEVILENDSESAFEIFRSSPKAFDAVLTDYAMPRMTGTELAQALRAIRPDLPIIIMTGAKDAAEFPIEENSEISVVLSKPVALRELSDAVREAME